MGGHCDVGLVVDQRRKTKGDDLGVFDDEHARGVVAHCCALDSDSGIQNSTVAPSPGSFSTMFQPPFCARFAQRDFSSVVRRARETPGYVLASTDRRVRVAQMRELSPAASAELLQPPAAPW